MGNKNGCLLEEAMFTAVSDIASYLNMTAHRYTVSLSSDPKRVAKLLRKKQKEKTC